MGNLRKKKYEAGEASRFITRKTALNMLQLPLKSFRQLCILKGIYPREPKNRKRAQKGSTGIHILYAKKDIQFLMHEPLIWTFRDLKVFAKRIGKAKALKDRATVNRNYRNLPELKLDHIVKERYPTFIDALRDLDDCLTLCFLFSTFPSMRYLNKQYSALCKRLTVEFLHAVIEAKALRKVFISIKGYYFQAEIKGQTITWIVPHQFGFAPQDPLHVDFKIMATFVEFYTVMLGFINFRLYHSLNLVYPPNITGNLKKSDVDKSLIDKDAFVSERVASLNIPLSKANPHALEEDIEIDSFDMGEDAQKIEEKLQEAEKLKKLKTLFKGLKFFLNREVPREPLVFVLRCFGGEVSWDKTLFLGATFEESDETITHHIIDRPMVDKQYISRYYVQPQWVFDSVNARELLPVNKYFIGAVLPPHLSPFIDPNKREEYVPPEEMALRDPSLIERYNDDESESEDEKTDDEEEKEEEDDNEDIDEQSESEDNETHTEADEKAKKTAKLAVTPGEVTKEKPWEKIKEANQEYRLREKMVKNKHRYLYRNMMQNRRKRSKEVWLLKKKRRLLDERETQERKEKKKQLKHDIQETAMQLIKKQKTPKPISENDTTKEKTQKIKQNKTKKSK